MKEPVTAPNLQTEGVILPDFVTSAWNRDIVRPTLIAVMVTCIATVLITIVALVNPDGGVWTAVPILCFFFTLEGLYTSRWINHPDRLILDRTLITITELVMLTVLLRLMTWMLMGWPSVNTFLSFILQPTLAFENFFVIPLLFVLGARQMAFQVQSVFKKLAIHAEETRYYSLNKAQRARLSGDRPAVPNRTAFVNDYFRTWLWGGILLVIGSALTTLQLSELTVQRNPFQIARLGLEPQILISLLVYFIAGFWLLSQGKLEVMNARWMVDGIKKHATIEGSWRRHSFSSLFGIAFLASLLPIGSTVPLSHLVDLMLRGVSLIVGIILLLFNAFLALIFSSADTPIEEVPITPEPIPTLPPIVSTPIPNSPPSANTELLFGSFFWAALLTAVIFALLYFFRERKFTLNGQVLRQAWQQLVGWFQLLWQGVHQQVEIWQGNGRFPSPFRKKTPEQTTTDAWRFIRVNGLTPRQQIRYFYLSLVRRAEKKGVERSPHQTPLEFAQDLADSLPEEAELDVDDLTQAFLKARYSPKSIEAEEASTSKNKWKRLRSSLRKKRGKQ